MGDYLQLFRNKPYLAWDVKNVNQLSPQNALERIYNYGNWEDYLQIESILGISQTSKIFKSLTNKARINLRPQTINYFNHYYQKYAS